jgi:SAM-dependent methyltransferase
MHSSMPPHAVSAAFDDPNLVANSGLVPVMRLSLPLRAMNRRHGSPTTRPRCGQGASVSAQSDADYYADHVRLLEPAYLRGTTPQAGSGFGGDAERWRARREMIVDGVHRAGTFLDVGCANGLLMESVQAWAGERGLAVEPYGVDIAPRLVELARRRLPHWAGRIQVANAIDYEPADGRRFTFVHVLLDAVPPRRHADLVRHALGRLVEPGGRLLVSHYQADGGTGLSAGEQLRRLGFQVAGTSRARDADGGGTTAWLES